MSIKGFLKYVEIQTKVASVIPFILGALYAKYRYNNFYGINFLVMLVSLLSFDMATTAINNYIDFTKSQEYLSRTRDKETFIKEGISERKGIFIITVLLSIAIVFGVILTVRTNIIVLLVGAVAFGIGIFYTYGPIPISRMPLGEMFSGFFMGFVILFLSIYIHVFNYDIVRINMVQLTLSLNINLKECFSIFLVSVPAIVGIANIMLANNICDVEEDMKINRFTLPYYLGREKALSVFKILYYIGYIDIVIIVILKIAPMALILVLLTIIPVNRGIKKFITKQDKSTTFALSVKNFVIMTGSQIIVIGFKLLNN